MNQDGGTRSSSSRCINMSSDGMCVCLCLRVFVCTCTSESIPLCVFILVFACMLVCVCAMPNGESASVQHAASLETRLVVRLELTCNLMSLLKGWIHQTPPPPHFPCHPHPPLPPPTLSASSSSTIACP